MARKSSFNTGQFISENPLISLVVLGGVSYVGYSIYRSIKKGRQGSKEASEKNPFNYTVFITNAEAKAEKRKQKIKSISTAEAKKFAEKLHNTWNTFGFDYPEEAVVIIKNMPSKYDLAKVLQVYNDTYGFDYQAKIKDKYNEDNYDLVITTALDLGTDYRF
jgi:hypothetical protein